jgi:hypothetical protein
MVPEGKFDVPEVMSLDLRCQGLLAESMTKFPLALLWQNGFACASAARCAASPVTPTCVVARLRQSDGGC